MKKPFKQAIIDLGFACRFLCRLQVWIKGQITSKLILHWLFQFTDIVFPAGPRFRSSFQTSPDESSQSSIFHHGNLLVTRIRFWLFPDVNLTEKNSKTVLINLCSCIKTKKKLVYKPHPQLSNMILEKKKLLLKNSWSFARTCSQ